MFRTVPLSIIRNFFHCTHSNGIRHTGLLTACEQDQGGTARKLSTNLYDIHHCCVYSEKTPDDGQEELSETCRVSFQK